MKSERIRILFFIISFFKDYKKVNQGCCSWHGGISHVLPTGKVICKDGTKSSFILITRKED